IPRLTVLALADIVTPEDLYEDRNALVIHLPRAFEYVCTDPEWAQFVDSEVSESSPRTQYLIVRLYEKATGKRLLPEAVAPELLAESMRRLRELKEELSRSTPSKVPSK